jgi:glycosyltransferase involved in cell wall biosynthesis
MKIDIVITELETGGAERFCVELASFLSTNQHRVRVIAIGKQPLPPKDALWRRLRSANISCTFLGCQSAKQIFIAKNRLQRLVAADPPDIAQSILWHANVLSGWVYPRYHVPLVGGVRICDPRRWRFWVSRWATRRMQKVLCVSQSTLEWCRDVERLDASKLMVIPNGVDVEKIQRDANQGLGLHDVPLDKPILLFVGRLDYQKGIDILMQRAAEILDALPQHQLVIIGDGPYRDTVRSMADASCHQKRIHVLGQRDDVPGWMKRSQLVILPTRYEGMPNTILEAMALSKPVATMCVEGMQEILGEGVSSQAAPRNDWNHWVKLVIKLGQDDKEQSRLGQCNAARAGGHFGLSDQLNRYESLYQSLHL